MSENFEKKHNQNYFQEVIILVSLSRNNFL
jgi:hypothetical protein